MQLKQSSPNSYIFCVGYFLLMAPSLQGGGLLFLGIYLKSLFRAPQCSDSNPRDPMQMCGLSGHFTYTFPFMDATLLKHFLVPVVPAEFLYLCFLPGVMCLRDSHTSEGRARPGVRNMLLLPPLFMNIHERRGKRCVSILGNCTCSMHVGNDE